MTPLNFAYWLQGLLEMQPDLKTLDENQVSQLRAHLNLVFEHAVPQPGAPVEGLRPYVSVQEILKPPRPTGVVDTSRILLC